MTVSIMTLASYLLARAHSNAHFHRSPFNGSSGSRDHTVLALDPKSLAASHGKEKASLCITLFAHVLASFGLLGTLVLFQVSQERLTSIHRPGVPRVRSACASRRPHRGNSRKTIGSEASAPAKAKITRTVSQQ